MQGLRLEKKLPPALRGDIYNYMIDAIDIEIQNYRSLIAEKLGLIDTDSMDYNDLILVSNRLGVSFSSSVYGPILENTLVTSTDADLLAFLRGEVSAIPFKIAYKSTVKLYESFYKALSRVGEVFTYYYKDSSSAIIREAVDPLDGLVSASPESYYIYQSDKNYTGSAESSLTLDSGLSLDALSAGTYWTLDTTSYSISTCHIGIEFIIDRLVTKITANSSGNSISATYLLSNGFFEFIQKNFDFTRRVVEVPHVGAQLGVLMDGSHTIDSAANVRTHTIPSLNVDAVTTFNLETLLTSYPNNNAALQLYKIGFGIGAQSLPSQSSPSVALPSSLAEPVASSYIYYDEKYENDDWIAVSGTYQGQKISDFLLHDKTGYQLSNVGSGAVDGSNHAFTGHLLYAPIKKGQLSFYFKHSALQQEITDDGKGNLIISDSDGNSGTVGSVSYESDGAYSFNTTFPFTKSLVIATSVDPSVVTNNGGTKEVIATLSFDGGSSITPSTVWIYYYIGNRVYVLHDNGSNGFVTSDGLNPYFTSGSINYTTGAVVLEFSVALDYDSATSTGTDVTAQYSFIRTYTPDANTEITVNYYFTYSTIDITEAGLFDVDGNMIAYMKFPPVEFANSNYHLNVHFYIRKGIFTT
jgi:hypothetical protein